MGHKPLREEARRALLAAIRNVVVIRVGQVAGEDLAVVDDPVVVAVGVILDQKRPRIAPRANIVTVTPPKSLITRPRGEVVLARIAMTVARVVWLTCTPVGVHPWFIGDPPSAASGLCVVRAGTILISTKQHR